MEIKFVSDHDLSELRMLELYNMIPVIRSPFHEGNKYYPQVFLHEYLYKL